MTEQESAYLKKKSYFLLLNNVIDLILNIFKFMVLQERRRRFKVTIFYGQFEKFINDQNGD